MKKYVVILSITLFSLTTYSQNITLSGRIQDQKNKTDLEYANVTLGLPDGTLITGTVSDSTGRFTLPDLNSGTYKLSIGYVGYQTRILDVTLGELTENYDLGRIYLDQTIGQIQEVTIAGAKSEVAAGMEKKVFELDDRIAQSGGTILDAMKTLPGVTFDQDGKVLLRGSDKVMILVDSKQSGLTGFGRNTGLNNLPASNVESIEIINNPSAKYDASGMAGIINIKFKKENEQGFHGSAALNLNYLPHPQNECLPPKRCYVPETFTE